MYLDPMDSLCLSRALSASSSSANRTKASPVARPSGRFTNRTPSLPSNTWHDAFEPLSAKKSVCKAKERSHQGFFLYTEAKTQITEIPKLRSNFCQNSVQFVQNSDFTTPWGLTKKTIQLQGQKSSKIMHFCNEISICSKIFHKTSLQFSHFRQSFYDFNKKKPLAVV